MNMDPGTIHPTAGKLLVEIVEVLGGKRGALYIPPATQDHMGKDTFYGRILEVGPAPAIQHDRSMETRSTKNGQIWSDDVMAQFTVGDIMIFPRDVPLAFGWEELRYALVLMHEGLFRLDPTEFDPTEFEVVPWTPPPLP